MKRKFVIILVLVLSTILMSFGAVSFSTLNADISNNISASDFEDSNLYSCLLLKSGNNVLTANSFINTESLDLSYLTINNADNIAVTYTFYSLKGLELFHFDNLKELNISGHSISTISNYLNNAVNLQTLDLSSNDLSSVDLSAFSKLKNVCLQDNNFEDFSSIVLSSTKPTKEIVNSDGETISVETTRQVYVSHNYLNLETLPTDQTVNEFKVGFQGIHAKENKYGKQIISFIPYDNTTSVNIYKVTTNENNEQVETLTFSLSFTENETLYNSIEMPYGSYKIKFNSTDDKTSNLFIGDFSFSIKVKKPTLKMLQNDQLIDNVSKVYKKTTINFEGDGEIVVKLNGNELSSNSYTINKYGKYTFVYYQVIDGEKSDEVTTTILSLQDNYWQFIYILLAIVAFVVATALILLFINRPKKGQLKTREHF